MSFIYFPLFFPDAAALFEAVVTSEEFNAFHSIDRTFFYRLFFLLNRDKNRSYEIFSFLYMLERIGYVRNIISYLVSLPDDFISSVANEVVVCLNILHNEAYSTEFFKANTNDDHNYLIPMIIQLTGGKLTLRFIHHNREDFLEGLTKNMANICRRAFDDISERADMHNKEKPLVSESEKSIEEMQKLSLTTTTQQGTTSSLTVPQEITIGPSLTPEKATRPETATGMSVRPETAAGTSVRRKKIYRPKVEQVASATSLPPPHPDHDQEEVNNEVMLATEDRAVFLRFCKGFPISKEEVRVYFTEAFGDVIEEVVMQDVKRYHQPLFGKMVLKNRFVSKLIEIVTPRNRNQFTINGKYVWVCKYIPKKSPSASSSRI